MEIIAVTLLSLAAVAAVFVPLLRANTASNGVEPVLAGRGEVPDEAAIDAAVRRYRTAIRAGTVCRRCLRANPEGSRFCADCGAGLPAAEAG